MLLALCPLIISQVVIVCGEVMLQCIKSNFQTFIFSGASVHCIRLYQKSNFTHQEKLCLFSCQDIGFELLSIYLSDKLKVLPAKR